VRYVSTKKCAGIVRCSYIFELNSSNSTWAILGSATIAFGGRYETQIRFAGQIKLRPFVLLEFIYMQLVTVDIIFGFYWLMFIVASCMFRRYAILI
jgi:hypothetical protein